ncbi:chorismate mutase [Alicyclobacillus fastidiosus]|uniref:Chorismate mutase n=1 Tax=Alicyclobacillus fastidiosus TaxID=392011 RepID=A0ABY6ZDT7_9BACL|nr:chorismate mutase [Alicyclobacillus fastidiosus]WAH41004.1 chorismate mutase [Alicyclobacillus fastidiosus]GMA62519.1 hypothetical protein GCM10025859_29590 [Alicyclobacillus fastidiosus]
MTEETWASGIGAYRAEIDGIDEKVIEAIALRFAAARKIAELKGKWAKPVVQIERARQVEQSYIELGSHLSLSKEFMSRLYHLIHEETCRVEADIVRLQQASEDDAEID